MDRTRLATWPLAAFLMGLLWTIPPRTGGPFSPGYLTALSFGVGCLAALLAFVAALILNRRLGPTRTALPFTRGPMWHTVLFSICLGTSFDLKMLGLFGVPSVLIGAVPIYMIARAASRDADVIEP